MLNDNETKKALECCCKETTDCEHCPANRECEYWQCFDKVKMLSFDLINRLQDEKQNLEIELKAMRGAANSYKTENERLTIRLRKAEHQLDDLCKMHNIIKAEAYKECIEKINKNLSSRASFGSLAESVICENIISENDNLYKELIGE